MVLPDITRFAAPERDLIARIRNGDDKAFSGLVEMYKDRIHQFILCILGPDREAEDLVQEVFIQIYRSLPAFRGSSSFSTWAYAIARNVCRHQLRKRGRDNIFTAGDESEALYSIPESGPTQELAMETEETKALVRSGIDALSPIHRSVIFLSCWEKLSYAEMAEALGIPVGTVRSRLHNALAALAERLKTVLAEDN